MTADLYRYNSAGSVSQQIYILQGGILWII